MYAGGRLGTYSKTSTKYLYELTDHLGNVRAVVSRNSGSGLAEVLSFTDYYPHGGPLPSRNYVSSPAYTFNGVQGNMKDAETSLTNFELRQMDPRLGRWFAPDPKGQFHSPYVSMANNPVCMVDPDGGAVFGGTWSDIPMDNYMEGMNYSQGGWNTMTPQDRGYMQQMYGTNQDFTFWRGNDGKGNSKQFANKGKAEDFAWGALPSGKSPQVVQFPDYEDTKNGKTETVEGGDYTVGSEATILANDYKRTVSYHIFGELAYGASKHNGDDNPYMYTRQEMHDQAMAVAEYGSMLIPVGEVFQLGKWASKGLATLGRAAGILSKPGGRVFWSGGEKAMELAAHYAKSTGRKTLEMTLGGKTMSLLNHVLPRSLSTPMWRSLSTNFAKGATESVHFFNAGNIPRASGIWNTVERPLLEKNGIKIILE